MIKEHLTIINKPNILDLPQSTIDALSISPEDKDIFISSVKMFSNRAKNHSTYPYVLKYLKNNFNDVDIIYYNKHPQPAIYNKRTRRSIINIYSTTKKSVSNVNMRDLYTLTVYMNCCSVLSSKYTIDSGYSDIFAEYMGFVFLKLFAKKYGITGSYVDKIPSLKFLVFSYVYQSFFKIDSSQAYLRSSRLSKIKSDDIKIDLRDYNFSNFDDFLKSLSDSDVLPGINKYKFLDSLIRLFGVMNLVFFEDIMRFSSILISSSINGNSLFSPAYQMYNVSIYNKLLTIIEKTLNRDL